MKGEQKQQKGLAEKRKSERQRHMFKSPGCNMLTGGSQGRVGRQTGNINDVTSRSLAAEVKQQQSSAVV